MAEKEPMIVIKKITIVAGGGHGGAWKVAFADFMTAMMAFFLVMWLVNATEDVKQNVSDYFSTPSIIEYNFSNYGVELTLEKLFLDLMNEPLRFFEQFITPADHTPNMMMMGTKKIVMHHIADTLGDIAKNVEVHENVVEMDIPADILFIKGTGNPSRQFVDVTQKIKELTEGLEDSNVFIDSRMSPKDAGGSRYAAQNISEKRLDLVSRKIEVSLEHDSVDIYRKTTVKEETSSKRKTNRNGYIHIKIKQKPVGTNGKQIRKIEDVFGGKATSSSLYESFVEEISNK